jgi:hypothetical protein
LFGRVAATAKKKAASVYTYGICRCLELIIFQEEQLFRDTLAAAVGLEKPVDLEEGASEQEIELYQGAIKFYEDQVKQLLMAALQAQQIPPGVKGLIPDGDLSMQWRWLGPVYEDSTQDTLNNSIVVRNLQELGVDSIEALKYLFPSKTDEERAAMLSGFPFRMVNELQGAYSQFAKLVGGMMQTPHPQSPDLPMAADPRLDLTPYLYRTLEALQKEMSYAGRYRPIDPTDEPNTSSDSSSKQLRGSSTSGTGTSGTGTGTTGLSGGYELPTSGTSGSPQLPIKPYSVRPPIPTGGVTGGQSMGIGVQQGNERPEYSSPIPIPGSVLSDSDTVRPGKLSTAEQRPSYSAIGSPDLVSQPDILGQLFPNLFQSLIRGSSGSGGDERGQQVRDERPRDRGTSDTKQVRPKPRRNARRRS